MKSDINKDNLPLVIVLAAGMGSRLGRPNPKCLTSLGNGETILSRQIRILSEFNLDICCVVGFKKDLIMEAAPGLIYAYNPNYDTTNTSKSLLCGLRHSAGRDVLWINGDVVFTSEIIGKMLIKEGSLVAVNNARVAEEEVKYTVDNDGYIDSISKDVKYALGEALGINKVSSKYTDQFAEILEQLDDNDYFEKGMENMIKDGCKIFKPVNVSDYACIEIDFQSDLEDAIEMLKQ